MAGDEIVPATNPRPRGPRGTFEQSLLAATQEQFMETIAHCDLVSDAARRAGQLDLVLTIEDIRARLVIANRRLDLGEAA
jgi:hypothetical protein